MFFRPPERRHGYEQQFHSLTAQPEHEALEAKRPRMETVAEAHITRTPPAAGGVVLPMPHTVQDSLRATVEVKKVGLVSHNLLLKTKKLQLSHLCFCFLRDSLIWLIKVKSVSVLSVGLYWTATVYRTCELSQPFPS